VYRVTLRRRLTMPCCSLPSYIRRGFGFISGVLSWPTAFARSMGMLGLTVSIARDAKNAGGLVRQTYGI
jgi:hypothetical protein